MQSTEILLAIDLLVYKTEYATLVPGVGYLILSIPIGLADLWVIATYTCCYKLLLLYILTAALLMILAHVLVQIDLVGIHTATVTVN